MNWEIFLASFAGSLIELVEILGVAIVVGRVAGWQNAFVGSGTGIVLVLAISLVLGKSLTLIPVDILRVVAGGFLIFFGQGWMRSVVRYYAGIRKKKADDEEEQLQQQLEQEGVTSRWNWLAIIVTFKSAVLETVEIAIAVVTLGVAAGQWLEAISGAAFSGIGLIVFALVFSGPLNRVPVKAMKFAAAMLLMGFGSYWLSEGLGLHVATGELAMVWLPLVWGLLMAGTAAILRWKLTYQEQVTT
jgi:uncharacterized membrane protein